MSILANGLYLIRVETLLSGGSGIVSKRGQGKIGDNRLGATNTEHIELRFVKTHVTEGKACEYARKKYKNGDETGECNVFCAAMSKL
jgi:hypothetical protein